MQKIGRGTLLLLPAVMLTSTRCVVPLMFYGPISRPMTVDDQSRHETALGRYLCA